MSTAFNSIKRGLLEAIEHAEGRAPQARIHRPRPIDVKALRAKVHMTQEQFAARFGIAAMPPNAIRASEIFPSFMASEKAPQTAEISWSKRLEIL